MKSEAEVRSRLETIESFEPTAEMHGAALFGRWVLGETESALEEARRAATVASSEARRAFAELAQVQRELAEARQGLEAKHKQFEELARQLREVKKG